jgi:hypothetical protein
MEIQLHAFLTSALDGVEWIASRPGRFTPRERAPGTHSIEVWVGPRASLDAVVKREIPTHSQDLNPPIIQPIAQRYTTELVRLLKRMYKYIEVEMLRNMGLPDTCTCYFRSLYL